MEFNTKNRMDAQIYPCTRHNLEEMVFGMEIRRETTRWDELVRRFKVTFKFEHESPSKDVALWTIQTKIFSE
jgi:hypothetical protein